MIDLTPRMSDLTGQTFGQLTALYPVRVDTRGQVYWAFKCTCGNITEILGRSAKTQNTNDPLGILPSCGCFRKKFMTKRGTKHGFSKHPLYAIYKSMKQRCYNSECVDYSSYGAKGVRVCDEWLENPAAFCRWALSNGWYQGCHVDKDIKNKALKLYSPDTCSIVSPNENLSFTRKG